MRDWYKLCTWAVAWCVILHTFDWHANVKQIKTLQFMHEAGVIHRDIHPHNIILWEGTKPAWLSKLPDDLPVYLFADFELSLLNGKHPTVPANATKPSYVYSPSSADQQGEQCPHHRFH